MSCSLTKDCFIIIIIIIIIQTNPLTGMVLEDCLLKPSISLLMVDADYTNRVQQAKQFNQVDVDFTRRLPHCNENVLGCSSVIKRIFIFNKGQLAKRWVIYF